MLTTERAISSLRSLRGALARIAFAGGVMTLAMASAAHAGTYVINNCPSAPTGNGDSGPWVIFGSPQLSKGSCSGGSRDWIGPRAGSMSPGAADGVQVTVPAGSAITIREAKVWWQVPHQISGADTFAVAYANGSGVGESTSPLEWQATADVFVLASSTTTFTLEDYCSNDDAGQGCVFGGGENPNLQLFGSQLTLADGRRPTGSVTGGGLASTGALSGTQSLAYNTEDADSGVRLVQLLIDGQPVASNDYIAKCPYTNWAACPSSESDSVSWNTASVADGRHDLEAAVEDAAQNTSVIYTSTVTTQNAPVNTTTPTILAPSQASVAAALSTQPGTWSAPSGAGPITYGYQWEDCDTQGNSCQAIGGAQNSSYTPTPGDVGHTLRVLVTAVDNDGSTAVASATTGAVLSPLSSLGALPGPGTGGEAAAGLPAAGSGAPNGTGASETAQLRLGVPLAISRSFARRAFKLTGRLLDGQGRPIGGATLDVLQQLDGSNTPQVIRRAKTSSSGALTVAVPAGPSRLIEIAYRAFAGDASYAAEAEIEESVGAGVQLDVAPRHTSSTGTIVLRGRVLGPIPPPGLVIELLVHYRGHWEPFRDPRSDSSGRFQVVYEFEGGVGRFPFRAEVLGGQSGFPFTHGDSRPVDVTTN
jgi:hypothetical protein